jgi:hypothetical protein
MILSLLDINKQNSRINKNQITESYFLNGENLKGNKTFTEVRIVRTKLIKGVFSDVITKYQYKDDPCPPDDKPVVEELASNINLLITKYSI